MPPPALEAPVGRIIASNWQHMGKGSLIAFVDLELPSGIVLRDCGVHQKDGARWVNLPVKRRLDRDGSLVLNPKTGKPAYSRCVDIRDPARREQFKKMALAAVDALCGREER